MAIHRRGVDVVLTDADFPDGLSWKDLVEEVVSMPAAPPVIVVSPSLATNCGSMCLAPESSTCCPNL